MGFSSVAAWVAACQETQLPMWEVILRQDLDQDTPEARAASLKQMEHMWEVMKNSALQYQSEQRSYSGLVGGDGARYADVACQAKRKKVTRKTQKTALIYPIYGNQSGFSYVI